jgi:osmotically inducible protein OsmC
MKYWYLLWFGRTVSLVRLVIRKASVQWKGNRNGGGQLTTTESGMLKEARLSSSIPPKENSATNPAELIAAAHAGSFSLALANELGLTGSASGLILTTATVSLEHSPTGWTIMNIHLNVVARLPKVTQGKFIDAAVRAKTDCLISRLLRANISMSAKLEK